MPGYSNVRSMLILFALTAVATIVGRTLPPGSGLRPIALLLDAVPIAGAVAATAWAFRSLRSRADSRTCLLGALSATFNGGLIGALGVAHTSAVVLVAIERTSVLDPCRITGRPGEAKNTITILDPRLAPLLTVEALEWSKRLPALTRSLRKPRFAGSKAFILLHGLRRPPHRCA